MLIWVRINIYSLLRLAHENKPLQRALHGTAAPLFQLQEVPMDTEDEEAELEVPLVMGAPLPAAAEALSQGGRQVQGIGTGLGTNVSFHQLLTSG